MQATRREAFSPALDSVEVTEMCELLGWTRGESFDAMAVHVETRDARPRQRRRVKGPDQYRDHHEANGELPAHAIQEALTSYTGEGPVVIGWDSVGVIINTAWRAWLRRLAKHDTSIGHTDKYHVDWNRRDLCTSAHLDFLTNSAAGTDRSRWATVTGVARDARYLARVRHRPAEEWKCKCGMPGPSAAHLTFFCPERADPGLPPPDSPLESRYLLCPVLRRKRREGHCLGFSIVQNFAERVRAAGGPRTAQGQMLRGSNGGEREECASWAVSEARDGSILTMGDAVHGIDTTPGTAEAIAFYMMARYIEVYGDDRTLHVAIIDNRNVIRAHCGGRGHLTAAQDELWTELFHRLRNRAVEAHWCPSHGNHPEWSPPADRLGHAARWRRLNRAADEKCTAIIHAFHLREAANRAEDTLAKNWMQRALSAQVRSMTAWHDHAKPWDT